MFKLQWILALLYFLLYINIVEAQHPGWTNYTDGDTVTSIVTKGNDVWVGTIPLKLADIMKPVQTEHAPQKKLQILTITLTLTFNI